MSSEPKTLPEVESSIWHELSSAIVDGSQWRFPVLATIKNGEPKARTIVLRAADRASRILLFHTDARVAEGSSA